MATVCNAKQLPAFVALITMYGKKTLTNRLYSSLQ